MLYRILRRISHWGPVRRAVGRLRLDDLARQLYFRCYRAASGAQEVMRVERAGLAARFYVRDACELRAVETMAVFSERAVAERLLREVRPGDTVYDVGANIGAYTVFLAIKSGPRGCVVAFEPLAEVYRRLLDNVELNGLSNVRALPLALADRAGILALYWRLPFPQCSDAELRAEAGDDLVAARGLPLPRVLKIDVDGHELSVVRGLARTLAHPCCELLCCEVHPHLLPPGGADDLGRLLYSLGFQRLETFGNREDAPVFRLIASKQP